MKAVHALHLALTLAFTTLLNTGCGDTHSNSQALNSPASPALPNGDQAACSGAGNANCNLSYHIEEALPNGATCVVDSPVYHSQPEYCQALETPALNSSNGMGMECGFDYRHTLFLHDCRGMVWSESPAPSPSPDPSASPAPSPSPTPIDDFETPRLPAQFVITTSGQFRLRNNDGNLQTSTLSQNIEVANGMGEVNLLGGTTFMGNALFSALSFQTGSPLATLKNILTLPTTPPAPTPGEGEAPHRVRDPSTNVSMTYEVDFSDNIAETSIDQFETQNTGATDVQFIKLLANSNDFRNTERNSGKWAIVKFVHTSCDLFYSNPELGITSASHHLDKMIPYHIFGGTEWTQLLNVQNDLGWAGFDFALARNNTTKAPVFTLYTTESSGRVQTNYHHVSFELGNLQTSFVHITYRDPGTLEQFGAYCKFRPRETLSGSSHKTR